MGATSYSRNPLGALTAALRKRKHHSLQCIAHARVPIIKLVDSPSLCLVDISFDIPNGPANTHIVKVRVLLRRERKKSEKRRHKRYKERGGGGIFLPASCHLNIRLTYYFPSEIP